jgi:hypothetical protein
MVSNYRIAASPEGKKSSLNSLKLVGSMSGREEKVAKKNHSGYGGDEKRSSATASMSHLAVELVTLVS